MSREPIVRLDMGFNEALEKIVNFVSYKTKQKDKKSRIKNYEKDNKNHSSRN